MKSVRICVASLLVFSLSACGRPASDTNPATAPAVGPITPGGQPAAKHYTTTDFAQACFDLPSQNNIIQFKAFLHLTDQEAIDYAYRQDAEQYPVPPGECEIKKRMSEIKRERAQHQNSSQGGWIENAPANDMSHYADFLPGGKH